MMTPKKFLSLVDRSFGSSKRWTQGCSWRTQKGEHTNSLWNAHCYCLSGAIERIDRLNVDQPGRILARVATTNALKKAIHALGDPRWHWKYTSIIDWNDQDSRTFEEIKGVLQDARKYLDG